MAWGSDMTPHFFKGNWGSAHYPHREWSRRAKSARKNLSGFLCTVFLKLRNFKISVMCTFFEKWALLARHDHAKSALFTRFVPKKHAKNRKKTSFFWIFQTLLNSRLSLARLKKFNKFLKIFPDSVVSSEQNRQKMTNFSRFLGKNRHKIALNSAERSWSEKDKF